VASVTVNAADVTALVVAPAFQARAFRMYVPAITVAPDVMVGSLSVGSTPFTV
jgi:hypothetical protein